MSHPLPCVHGQRNRTRRPQGPHGQRKRKRGSRHRVHSTPRARQQVAYADRERTAGARALPSLRRAAAARVRPAPASAARAMHASASGQRVCSAAAATGIAPPARARPTDALPARSSHTRPHAHRRPAQAPRDGGRRVHGVVLRCAHARHRVVRGMRRCGSASGLAGAHRLRQWQLAPAADQRRHQHQRNRQHGKRLQQAVVAERTEHPASVSRCIATGDGRGRCATRCRTLHPRPPPAAIAWTGCGAHNPGTAMPYAWRLSL